MITKEEASSQAAFEDQEHLYEVKHEITPEPEIEGPALNTEIILNELREEIQLMLNYSLYNGLEIPNRVSQNLYSNKLSILLNIHSDLCSLISPATPKTIGYLKSISKKSIKFISPIPLMNQLNLTALISIILLISSGLYEGVNSESLRRGMLDSFGIDSLLNILFLCSAAAVGSTFFLLSKLTKEIRKATLSKESVSHYWTRLIIGILSGLILSELIIVNEDFDLSTIEINRLLFALLGGFSSELVYSVLEGIIAKIQALFISTDKAE